MTTEPDPPPASLELDPDLLDWTIGPPKRRGKRLSVSEYAAYRATPRTLWERTQDFCGRDWPSGFGSSR